jgi:hypothetical protein
MQNKFIRFKIALKNKNSVTDSSHNFTRDYEMKFVINSHFILLISVHHST